MPPVDEMGMRNGVRDILEVHLLKTPGGSKAPTVEELAKHAKQFKSRNQPYAAEELDNVCVLSALLF